MSEPQQPPEDDSPPEPPEPKRYEWGFRLAWMKDAVRRAKSWQDDEV